MARPRTAIPAFSLPNAIPRTSMPRISDFCGACRCPISLRPSLSNRRISETFPQMTIAETTSHTTKIATTEEDSENSSKELSLEQEVNRRRNLAIISHPDAGKTTLTEKLLLYGGAIRQAGAVRARRQNQKTAKSDWMKIEQERGISISSSVLSFEYIHNRVSILDTPGHQDFSEDTYRTLAAADNVVMLVDAAKGLEARTRALFEVCRMRKLPTFTFVNKLDRPALGPFELCDQIEKEFDLTTYPMVWPIGDGDRFKGVYERSTRMIHLYQRSERGQKAEDMGTVPLDDEEKLKGALGDELFNQLLEDVEILEEMGHEYDEDLVINGDMTPVFFGSAMTNFGVELFLKRFLEMGRPPAARESSLGLIDPLRQQFTGFVFKLQANMDPKHRDRLAFIRIVSGRFEKGMKVQHSRLQNRSISLTRPQSLFAADRNSVSTAFAGDVVGLNNPGVFAIGDTIYEGNEKVTFPGIPSFSPELFAIIKNPNPSAYKNFHKGINQLLQEGAVQMLRRKEDEGSENAILAAVGQLQFDVVQRRLQDEYNVESSLEMLPYAIARWVIDDSGGDAWKIVEDCGSMFNVFQAKDLWGRPVLLFKNQWSLDGLIGDNKGLKLAPWAFAPGD